jgi:dTDP-glucose pyrophosphorylase
MWQYLVQLLPRWQVGNQQNKGKGNMCIGVILAAGLGTRMGAFGNSHPKAIIPICNQPLIFYQIDIMRNHGIKDIIVLIGHKGYEISKVLGDGSVLGVNIKYVEQTSMLGIAHAVGRLEQHIDRPFLLILGDIFIKTDGLDEMFHLFESQQQKGAILATKEELDSNAIRKNYAVTLNDEGYVARVIEKPRYTSSRLKGVGLYLFDLSIFDAIRRTPRTAMRDEYEITDSIQVMIDDGQPVRTASVIEDDINLTSPEDILICNLQTAAGRSKDALISKSAIIHPSAAIENSIIGAGVKIDQPITINDTVIFDNTVVNTKEDLDYCVVNPEVLVQCRRR